MGNLQNLTVLVPRQTEIFLLTYEILDKKDKSSRLFSQVCNKPPLSYSYSLVVYMQLIYEQNYTEKLFNVFK